jgi:hypothetical protein
VTEHGSASTYRNHGCRCEACCDAATDKMRNYRSTEHGKRVARIQNRNSQRRASLAGQWVKRHRPDVWDEICTQVEQEARRG